MPSISAIRQPFCLGVIVLALAVPQGDLGANAEQQGDATVQSSLDTLTQITHSLLSGTWIEAQGLRTYRVRYVADPNAAPENAGLRREYRKEGTEPKNRFGFRAAILDQQFQIEHTPVDTQQPAADESKHLGLIYSPDAGYVTINFDSRLVTRSGKRDPNAARPRTYEPIVDLRWVLSGEPAAWTSLWSLPVGEDASQWRPTPGQSVHRTVTKTESGWVLSEELQVDAFRSSTGRALTLTRRTTFAEAGREPLSVELYTNGTLGKRWVIEWKAAEEGERELLAGMRPVRVIIEGFGDINPVDDASTSRTSFYVDEFRPLAPGSRQATIPGIVVPEGFEVIDLDAHTHATNEPPAASTTSGWPKWMWPVTFAAMSVVGLIALRSTLRKQ